MNYEVALEAAVPVYDVESPDEAVRIAISKTGNMLNPDLEFVEIETSEQPCPECDEEIKSAFVAADEGLVRLNLSMTVFSVDSEEHAERIAQKEIGQNLDNIPLEVDEVEEKEQADESDEDTRETEQQTESDEGVLPDFDEFTEN